MTIYTYEFTAFTEAALLEAGTGNGSNLGYGDSFTMPASADTTFIVTDNDAYLSGDSRNNENANDSSYQTAEIIVDGEEAGNGGQIYGEQYFWVWGQESGQWYLMIEIEQEGTGDDYFTFYNAYGVPPEGETLTVSCGGNINCWQPHMGCLESPPITTPPVAVLDAITITEGEAIGDGADEAQLNILDNDFDTDGTISLTGVNGGLPGDVITVTTEGGVSVDVTVDASGNLFFDTGSDFDALLDGQSDSFQLTYTITDNDGNLATSTVTVTIQGESSIDAVDDEYTVFEDEGADSIQGNVLDNDTNDFGMVDAVLRVQGQEANVGEWIDLDGGGRVRLLENGDLDFDADGDFEYLADGEVAMQNLTYTIAQMGEGSNDEYQCLFFGGHAAGTIIDDQYASNGVTISGFRSHDAGQTNPPNAVMIFNTANPTGGDLDLSSSTRGNVLIISEDFNSANPDDEAHGGTFVFEFDREADVESLVFLDTEEPEPIIRLFDENGVQIGDDIIGPVTTDGGEGIANINVSGVHRMEIELQGSGAIDNLIYTLKGEQQVVEEDTANVKINIIGLNDLEDGDEMAEVAEGSGATLLADNALTNAVDVDGGAPVVSSLDGQALNGGSATAAGSSGGTFTFDAAGNVTFDTAGAFAFLDEGQSIDTSITYEVSDGQGGMVTSTYTVKVTGAAGDPMIEAMNDEYTVLETEGAGDTEGNVLDNDDLPFAADNMVVEVNGVAGAVGEWIAVAGGGRFMLKADGDIDFDAQGAYNALRKDAVATENLTYTVRSSDGQQPSLVSIFNGPNGLTAKAEIVELNGELVVTVSVLEEGGDIGDIRGLFFDVADESLLSGMSATGADVTQQEFDANGVTNLGGGNNVNGNVLIALGAFDGGVGSGTSGIGGDDIRSTTFTLSHSSQALTLDLLSNQDMALRLTSVGQEGGSRGDSLKLGSVALPSSSDALIDSATVQINIIGLNEAPDAVDDVINTDENTAVGAINIITAVDGNVDPNSMLGEDSDPDAPTGELSVTMVTVDGVDIAVAAGGSASFTVTDTLGRSVDVTVDSAGNVTVAKPEGFDTTDDADGTFTFGYQITDADGDTDAALVTINVDDLAEPVAPDAVNDVINTDENNGVGDINIIAATDGNVDPNSMLGQDTDPDGADSALKVTKVIVAGLDIVVPANGSSTFTVTDTLGRSVDVTIDSSGNVTVATPEGFDTSDDTDGTFTFDYEITDEDGLTDVATVTINVDDLVEPVAPEAVDDVINTDEDTDVSNINIVSGVDGNDSATSVLGADSDPDGSVNDLTITQVTVGGNVIAVPATGTTTFTVDNTDGQSADVTIDTLGNVSVSNITGFDATDDQDAAFSFGYTIVDSDGLTDDATVTINIDDLAEPSAGPEVNVVFLLDASDLAISANSSPLAVGDLNGDLKFNSIFDASISIMQEAVANLSTALGTNGDNVDIGVFSFESQLTSTPNEFTPAVALDGGAGTVFDLDTDFAATIADVFVNTGTPFGDNGSDVFDNGAAFMAAAMEAANGFIAANDQSVSGDAINLVYIIGGSTGADIGNDYFTATGPGTDGFADGFLPIEFLENLPDPTGQAFRDANLDPNSDVALTDALLESQNLGLMVDTLYFGSSQVAFNSALFGIENFSPDAAGNTLSDGVINTGVTGKTAFLDGIVTNVTDLVDDLLV